MTSALTLQLLLFTTVVPCYALRRIDCQAENDCSNTTVICGSDDCVVHCGREKCTHAHIYCPAQAGLNCTVICDEQKSCVSATIHANFSSALDLICQHKNSARSKGYYDDDMCKQITVFGNSGNGVPVDDDQHFRVICGADRNSCNEAEIYCAQSMPCDIVCNGSASCKSAVITSPMQASLNIECSGLASCDSLLIHAEHASDLHVTECTAPNACVDMSIYCPIAEYPSCYLQGNDALGSPEIYAVHGWHDIAINYSGNYSAHGGVMHCGNDYEQQCDIVSDAWGCSGAQCSDDSGGLSTTTITATTLSSVALYNILSTAFSSPSVTDSDDDDDESTTQRMLHRDLVLVMICGALICAVCIALAFLCCVYQQRKRSHASNSTTPPPTTPPIPRKCRYECGQMVLSMDNHRSGSRLSHHSHGHGQQKHNRVTTSELRIDIATVLSQMDITATPSFVQSAQSAGNNEDQYSYASAAKKSSCASTAAYFDYACELRNVEHAHEDEEVFDSDEEEHMNQETTGNVYRFGEEAPSEIAMAQIALPSLELMHCQSEGGENYHKLPNLERRASNQAYADAHENEDGGDDEDEDGEDWNDDACSVVLQVPQQQLRHISVIYENDDEQSANCKPGCMNTPQGDNSNGAEIHAGDLTPNVVDN